MADRGVVAARRRLKDPSVVLEKGGTEADGRRRFICRAIANRQTDGTSSAAARRNPVV